MKPLPDPTAEALIAAGKRATAAIARRGPPDQFTLGEAEYEALLQIQHDDVQVLCEKRSQYGNSWLRRGGTGAYHVGIRHVDRIEAIAERFGYDLFLAIKETAASGDASMLSAIGDLRRYLLLWEAEAMRRLAPTEEGA